jgi:hypothetical protein
MRQFHLQLEVQLLDFPVGVTAMTSAAMPRRLGSAKANNPAAR